MASKRTINRAYWVTVKALTYGSPGQGSICRFVYRKAISGTPDREVMPALDIAESMFGPHKSHADLANPELWDARETVDIVRETYS